MSGLSTDPSPPAQPKLLSGIGGLYKNSDEVPEVETDTEEKHQHKEEENINIRAAVVHVIGDML